MHFIKQHRPKSVDIIPPANDVRFEHNYEDYHCSPIETPPEVIKFLYGNY